MAAFFVEDIVVGEGDGIVNIIVRLTEPAAGGESVNYAAANATAIHTSDYLAVSDTLIFAVGETSKVVQVQLLDNATAENLEHFTFNLSTPTNATIAKASAMVSIVDNDTVVDTPSLFVRDVVVDEKAGTASFVVMLGGPKGQSSNSAVTVDYATANGTAVAGADYTATGGTLTFAAGETVKTVVVDITDDALAEGLERFNLNLSNASGATILDGQGVAVIGANDAVAVAQPRISVSDLVASEADGYVDIVVSLSAPGQNPVSVSYAAANATAIHTSDYWAVSGTLNFAVGETTKVVRVELIDNLTAENLEHFTFNLSTPTNATIAKASAMVSIVDNDTVVDTPSLFVRDVVVDEKAGTASFVVMLGGPKGQSSNSAVTVDYATANGTAVAGADYTATGGTLTFAAGETVKTVVVDITDDALAEGLERFNLNLSNASGATILDGQGVAVIGANDAVAVAQPRISVSDLVASEADGYVDIVVSLSAPGQNPVSVSYAAANATAIHTSDYWAVSGTLNFAVGETTKVVRVELIDNLTAENLEHFTFNLSTPTNATIAKASAMVSIVDNDTVVDTPSLFVRDVVVDEKAGTASFVVMLGGPKGQSSNSAVTVDYATANGTAVAGADYTATGGTLTFAAGETVKTVVVDITDDALAEGLERFNLNLSNASGATILDGQGVAVIGANDQVAVAQPVISAANIMVSEADGYVDIVVRLSAPGQSAVSVNYAAANATAIHTSDYWAVSGTLNFAVGETSKVVRVELLDNVPVEPLETFRFNLSAPVNAILANTFATITIVDNDTAGINVYSYGISDDVYTVTAATDMIIENPGGGIDLAIASVSYTLPREVDNLTLIGGAVNGTGNALANLITGNALANALSGLDGNDTLNGSGGNDTLNGGSGNDSLNGGTGNDSMVGGTGNDSYTVNAAGDKVKELANQGTDTVNSSVTHTLAANVEKLTLTGSGNLSGTGNTLANTITGNSGNNNLKGLGGNDTVNGGSGNDTLDGGTGADRASGGGGNDRLIWDAADALANGGTGTDTLQVSGAGKHLNLTAIANNKIVDIEIINITGSGNNTLTLNASEVLAISSTINTLRVDGNAGDVVNAVGAWAQGDDQEIGSQTYETYTQGAATLLVDTDVTVL